MKRRLPFSFSSIIVVQMVIFTLMLTACQPAQIDPPNGLNQDEILTTREPPPVPTPSAVDEAIADFADWAGLGNQTVLGLPIDAWINIVLSLALVLGGYLLIVWLLRRVDSWMLLHMTDEEVKKWRNLIRPSVRWLVLVILLYLATIRLGFLSSFLRQTLLDIYFVVAVALLTNIAWRTIDLIAHLYRNRIIDAERLFELDPALTLLTRLARIFLVAIMVSIVLSHFGINVMALSAAVGLGGLALSLAARDTIADAIAGMIILFDRPFRVGDRIEIQEANTWGDVAEIGLRTTRIRTRDNRLVIVPNSNIVSNQIINYTYPDPFYRIQLDLGVGYETDVEEVRQIMIDTVHTVDGVIAERGVDALYLEMGDFAMIFRVRWWIESYVDTRRMIDKVNTALQEAFIQHGIESPYPTQRLLLHAEE